jgi:hypothetical protein
LRSYILVEREYVILSIHKYGSIIVELYF